jgi:hypothetical protein
MPRGMVVALVLLIVTLGVAGAEAEDCLPMWLDAHEQPVECSVGPAWVQQLPWSCGGR